MKKITFEDLMADDWHRQIISLCESIHGKPLPKVISDGLVDAANFSGVGTKQAVQWVKDFEQVCARIIDKSGNSSDETAFWIRLYEIMENLYQHYESATPLKCRYPAQKYVEELRGLFSGEEQILIEYERHCHAHIFQTGYRIKANYNKGKLTEDGLYRNGKLKTEINEVIDVELKKWKVDERAISRSFAERVLPTIRKLIPTMDAPFEKLPSP